MHTWRQAHTYSSHYTCLTSLIHMSWLLYMCPGHIHICSHLTPHLHPTQPSFICHASQPSFMCHSHIIHRSLTHPSHCSCVLAIVQCHNHHKCITAFIHVSWPSYMHLDP